MAFSYSVLDRMVFGDRRVVIGTFTNGSGDTGGDVKTGLNRVDVFIAQPTGSSVTSNQVTVNESFPLAGGDVTIVTDDNVDGIWIAIGV